MKLATRLQLFTILGLTSAAAASPTFQYLVQGELTSPATGSALVDDGVFGVQTTSGGSSGGILLGNGPINLERIEIFSDPIFAPFNTLEEDTRTFTLFGLLRTLDNDNNLIDTQFVIAAKPGELAGKSLTTVFAAYFTANPDVTTEAFLQAIDDGADFPEPGPNATFLSIRDFIEGDAPRLFAGDIGNSLQPLEEMELVAFSSSTLIGSPVGTLRVSTQVIPEPAYAGLFLPVAVLALLRRRG